MKLALGHLGTEFAPRLCIVDTDTGKELRALLFPSPIEELEE